MKKFNVVLFIANDNGESAKYNASIEFSHNPDDYGNGCHMGVRSNTEPFGFQAYDIRYNADFSKENPIPFIVQFYSDRFNGRNGAWTLTGITIQEAERSKGVG